MEYRTATSKEVVLHPLRSLYLAYIFCWIPCVVFHNDGDDVDIEISNDDRLD
jgi:hypothetical protein